MREQHLNRVLMVVQNCPFLDDSRVLFESYSLRNAGFSVSVVSPTGTGKDRRWFECYKGIYVYRFPSLFTGKGTVSYILEYLYSYIFILAYCLLIFCLKGFDIIHFANPPDIFFPIGFFCRLLGRKVVFDQHDLCPEVFTAKYGDDYSKTITYKLLTLFEKMSCRMANKVIATNDTYRDIIISRNGADPENVIVVRNSREAKCLENLITMPELKMGKRFLVIYMGVLSKQDGADYFLKAIAHIKHNIQRQDTQFAIVGDGDQLDDLKKLAVKLDVMDYVTFTGWLTGEALHAYLSMTDIGVSPEPYNGLNNTSTLLKILDYMSYGKPIVAFKLKETMYSAGPAAIYAKPNSAEDFAEKIVYLLDNNDLREKLGGIGYRRIKEKFSRTYSEEKLVRVYSEIAGTRNDYGI